MMKGVSSKALIIRINLIFLTFFLVGYAALLLSPFSLGSQNRELIIRCPLQNCEKKKTEDGLKMKAVLENQLLHEKRRIEGWHGFIEKIQGGVKIGAVNLGDEETKGWERIGEIRRIGFDKVSKNFEWKDLFPEWIDEEEENDGPSCPEIPMPDFKIYGELDMVVARLPCRYPEKEWRRDVFRLQVHLISANLAVKNSRKRSGARMRVLFLGDCMPMLELFPCDDLVKREGSSWFYEPDLRRLEQKISLPIGSCKLAMPLWGRGINHEADSTKVKLSTITTESKEAKRKPREAYATVLHSSEAYVCGAIALAQSILKTGSKRDLIILIDKSISQEKRRGISAAGWQIREITRIRNPNATKKSYNEYNYSKLRLWQLTDYDKVVFIDADIVVLRNLDILFQYPQLSATGNDGVIFNSGVMVIEPSNCTFALLMKQRKEVVSYNGGDQGFLNEVFTWWHRLPRRVNFLKNFWSNSSNEVSVKNQLFGSEPAKLFSIHYLGIKPWLCYKDYDCNWNIEDQIVYASNVAHWRWWKVHDSMLPDLQRFCLLSSERKDQLAWEAKKAGELVFGDWHWRLNITDPRQNL